MLINNEGNDYQDACLGAKASEITILDENKEDYYGDEDNALRQPLYEHCTYVGGYREYLCAYTPENTLDANLFVALTSDSELVNHLNIKVPDTMDRVAFDCEQMGVGDADTWDSDDQHPRCTVCKLCLPIDLDYYTSNDPDAPRTLCRICAIDQDTSALKVTKIESGIDNVGDWVRIFTYSYSYEDGYGGTMQEYEPYYCNLNAASKHYRKFASNYYTDMLGTYFEIITETSISEIIKKHCKVRMRAGV